MKLQAIWIGACVGASSLARAQVPPVGELPGVIEIPPDIEAPAEFFLRGDSNADKTLNIGDPIHILGYLFSGSVAVGCLKAADSNDDGKVDIGDPVSLLTFLFTGGPDPQSPLGECGVDLRNDALTCQTYSPCNIDTLPPINWYTVKLNGTACPREPCFDLTATETGDTGVEVLLTDLNLDHLPVGIALPGEDNAKLMSSLLEGRREAGGFLQDGPSNPGGAGRTLVLTNLRIANERFADLIVTALESTGKAIAQPRTGFSLPLRVRVENQGRLPIEQDFQVEVREHMRGGASVTRTVGPLGQGESISVTMVLTLPNAEPGDVVVLIATADSSNVVEESSDDNNSLSRSATLPDHCVIEIIKGKPVRICD